MKTQLNEIKRMQQLAGIISESQLEEEAQDVSPEKAASQVTKVVGSLEKSPVLNNVADKIANDPKALQQLQLLLSKSGINPSELSESIDSSIVQKLALTMAKKAEETPMNEEGFDYGGAFWSGLVGGGVLASYLASTGDVLTQTQIMLGQSPSHIVETIIGSIVGAIIAVVAKKVYDKSKGSK